MNEEQIIEMCDDIYCGESWQPMIDYITNLQNRIKELEEINKQHQELNGTLREKIDKAIEYIEEHTEKINKRFTIPKIDFNYNDLLNILQDKEEV